MDEHLEGQLRELDRESLVELIVSLHGRDAVIDRQIAAFAVRRSPSRHEAEIRSWIRDLTGPRRRGSYYESAIVGTQIDRILGEIGALIAASDPETTLGLVEQVLELGPRLLNDIDDSDAHISMALRDLGPLWLRAARRCRDAGVDRDWNAAVEDLLESDGYGLLGELLPNAALLLSEAEMRRMVRRYEELAAGEEEPHRRRFWLNRSGALAAPLRDPAVYLRAERLIEPDFDSARLKSMAQCFLELGDPRGALEWLESAWPEGDWGRLPLLAKAYGALGRIPEQIAVVRWIWETSPTVSSLEDFLALLHPQDKEQAKKEAGSRAAGLSNLLTALELLIFLERTAEAGELCYGRRTEIDGGNYYAFKELADYFGAQGQALAASLILRSLLEAILASGKSRAYHHAADYYEQLAKLSSRVGDWRGEPDHSIYCAGLRYHHGRKYGFWSRVKD